MVSTNGTFLKKCKQQRVLIFLSIPIVLYVSLFYYLPLWGWVLAFNDYQPISGFFGSEWVGFSNFFELFSDERFILVLRNTLGMSILNLTTGTFACIFIAIVLSEVRRAFIKRVVQTVSYLPFFVSWAAAGSIVVNFLSIDSGALNNILIKLHIISEPVMYLGEPKYFWLIIALSSIWKNAGYGAIVYLSSITSISPNLYEAAEIDGASRLKRIWHVTLPGIMPTIIILLLINIGNILNLGFEQQMLLGNPMVTDSSEVLDLFVLKFGISLGRYSYSVAAGMFKSVVSIILLVAANSLAKKMKVPRLY